MGIIYRVNNQNYEIYTTDHKPTPQEIGAALASHNHTFDSITGKPSTYTPTSHTHTKSQISDFPTSMTPTSHSHSFDSITGKPSSYAPSSHNHDASNITSGVIPIARGGLGNDSGYIRAGQKSGTTAGLGATIEGNNNTVYGGDYAHAEGMNNTVSAGSAHAEGNYTTASGINSHAEGRNTTASNNESHAEGHSTNAFRFASHAEGYSTTAKGNYAHAEGYNTIATEYQHAGGRFNVEIAGPNMYDDMTGSLLTVGNGSSDTKRSNAFRVATNGTVYGKAAFQSSGADYAEYFEWKDLNLNKEDRCGLFVTLDEDKIKIANSKDQYILGVISNIYSACCIGNGYFGDNWHNMYLKDEFNRPIKEKKLIKISKETKLEISIENDNLDDKYEEIEVENYILNPNWDKDQKYISREDRSEWDLVGMLGQLTVIDDGTCIPNQYCKVGNNGIATYNNDNSGYYVMKRLDDTHIKILFR